MIKSTNPHKKNMDINISDIKLNSNPMNHRNKTLIMVILIVIVLLFIYIAGCFITEDSISPMFDQTNQKPSIHHWFGTDWIGRDVFLRTIKGLSVSITIGILASCLSAVIATVIGIISATSSKYIDTFINWVINVVMGIPHMILLILISFACGRGMKGLLIGIVLTHWTGLARLIRGEVLQLRSEHYILVSRKLGKSTWWILKRHMLPHMVPQILIGLVLIFPHAILHEAAISFLGYGLPPEQPAIGIILSESMKYLSSGMWWLALYPGLILAFVVILFEKLGSCIKNIIDPFNAHN